MSFERLLLGLFIAAGLLILFLVAVREGRFASPRHRKAVVAAIIVAALLIWLVPFPAR
ncbi:MAG TPA: hypothetical protein VH331_19100 [Allosphingosinicella sp.]|jgi:hypothetical protein|nr:hypothetical protein [Allosphingosinicella sp.]